MRSVFILFCLVAGWLLGWAARDLHGSSIVQPEFQTVTRTLTPTEVQNLSTTPITLIPAQGTNSIIVFVTGSFWLEFQTAAYTGTGNVHVGYDGTEFSPTQDMWFIGNALVKQTASVFYPSILGTDSDFDSNTGIPVSTVANKAATVFADASLATGDSPITLQLKYYVRTLQ